MRSLILLFLLSALAGSLMSQVSVSGKLLDNRGKPVPGASISIKDSYDGATSDSAGLFRFSTGETGQKLLVITCIGYHPLEKLIELNGQPVALNLVLREEPNELKAVVVTAGSFEASDSKRTTVLNSIDIVTTASANADVTAAIRTLPGTQQVGEKEGLFVRGGSGEEARVFIDGTLVNNFFFTSVPDIASRGRFSPFLFKGTVFSSGGYSALYGQALSGALILETIDLPERSSASLGLSTVGISGGYQQLNKQKNASWGANYGYTNLLPYFELVKQRPDYFKVPAFHYGDLNFRIKTSKTGILKFYGTFQQSQLGLRTADIDSASLKNAFRLSNYNVYGNLSWKEKLGKQWKLYLGASYSNNLDDIGNRLQDQSNQAVDINRIPFRNKNFDGRIRSGLAQVKTVIDRRLGGLSVIRFGGEYLYFRDVVKFSDTASVHTIVNDHFKALFAEADIYISNNIAAKLGTRREHSSLLSGANMAPRVSLAYKLGKKGQLSLAYGIFYQKPERNQLMMNPDLDYTRAVHYIANYQKISAGYTFRAEAFYKKYADLVKTFPGINNNGNGYAKGAEVFWRDRKSIKGVDYWVSYSFLDTRRDYLNYPYSLQPNFAANHTASLVVKKFISKWKTQVNGSYSFATGRPYYNIRYNGNDGKYFIADQGKTLAYNNLSFSLNYLPSVGKTNARAFTVWVFSVTNVLNQKQVYNYNYSYNGLNRQPVRPPANQFFFLGCFISFGVDRTDDVINSNL
ncbi:carboxypeptidase-like regulatory domain-containing protein [Flavihumibacter stibioxidans]